MTVRISFPNSKKHNTPKLGDFGLELLFAGKLGRCGTRAIEERRPALVDRQTLLGRLELLGQVVHAFLEMRLARLRSDKLLARRAEVVTLHHH